jgi:hypothetical protein
MANELKAWIFCDKLDNLTSLTYTDVTDVDDFRSKFLDKHRVDLGGGVGRAKLSLLKPVSPVSLVYYSVLTKATAKEQKNTDNT